MSSVDYISAHSGFWSFRHLSHSFVFVPCTCVPLHFSFSLYVFFTHWFLFCWHFLYCIFTTMFLKPLINTGIFLFVEILVMRLVPIFLKFLKPLSYITYI